MDRQALADEFLTLIQEPLSVRNLELVELICRHEGRDRVFRILVDRPEGGITMAECAELNREISHLLDGKDILQERVLLEVSSPGLDRPLKTKNDFLRCQSRRARFFLNEPVQEKWEWEGVITRVEEASVYIDDGRGSIMLPLSKITWAKQIVDNI